MNLRQIQQRVEDAIWWIRHRTLDRYDIVRCDGLAPGYHECEDRMLHALFGILRDFVEIELALCYSADKKRNRWSAWIPWCLRWWPRNWKRSRAGGLRHLDWAITLVWKPHELAEGSPDIGKPTGQALSAREIKELYLWWVDVRPNRVEPDEERYEQEDEAMMKRLVAIRRSMWT